MKSIFIDTSTNHLILAYLSGTKVIDMIDQVVLKDMSSQLFPILDELLNRNSVSVQDLEKIYVVVGPGSFTGVRIGVTVAKTMAWGLNIPIVPISSLEVLASTGGDDYVCSYIDARRGYVYAGVYAADLNSVISDSYVSVDTLHRMIEEQIDGSVSYVSYDSIERFSSVFPKLDLERVISKYQNHVGMSPHMVNPVYLKLTEAEEKLLNENN